MEKCPHKDQKPLSSGALSCSYLITLMLILKQTVEEFPRKHEMHLGLEPSA